MVSVTKNTCEVFCDMYSNEVNNYNICLQEYVNKRTAANTVYNNVKNIQNLVNKAIVEDNIDTFFIRPKILGPESGNNLGVEWNGGFVECPNGTFSGCCYSVDGPDTKCCACQFGSKCNAGGGCLGNCNSSCTNGLLNKSRKQDTITSSLNTSNKLVWFMQNGR